MKVIDARSGNEIKVGSSVRYDDETGYDVLALDIGLFSGYADVESLQRDPISSVMLRFKQTVPLRVRYLHPSFLFQKIAFFPS